MGETPPDYAAGLVKLVQQKLGPAMQARVDVRSVYYQDILQRNQQVIWQRVEANRKVRYDDLRKFVLFGLGDAAGLENRK